MKQSDIMKLAVILAILIVLVGGCSTKTTRTISGTQELILDEQDLQQLGMTGHGCQTDDEYTNIVDSSLGQYSFCNYTINSLEDTEVIVQLQKFANLEALDGAYQYDSSHLYSVEGLISENDYGDKSRFRVNNEHDYGGQYNEPDVYFYHLWICKDKFLIHITSSGRSKDAKDYIARIGQQILSKFE
ncbi:MAG: hypothetical protein Q8O03_07680 [Nanoarchaeota archaeon]|nr:hypothetical protein [Nanoarchaeota archaeon]